MDREEMKLRASVMLDHELRDEWKHCRSETRPRWITDGGPDVATVRHATEMLGVLQVETNAQEATFDVPDHATRKRAPDLPSDSVAWELDPATPSHRRESRGSLPRTRAREPTIADGR